MDAETALLIECIRRRRALADELLGELSTALELYVAPPPPKLRTVSAPGYREVGVARFKATRVVSGTTENYN